VTLKLKAFIEVEFSVDPTYLSFGRISKNEVAKPKIAQVVGKELAKLKVHKVEADSPYVETKLFPPEKKGKGQRVEVSLKKGLPVGSFRSKVLLHSNNSKMKTATLSINAYITGNIKLSPERVIFRVSTQNSRPTQVVKLTNNVKKDFQILSAEVMEDDSEPKAKRGRTTYTKASKDDLIIKINKGKEAATANLALTFNKKLQTNERINGKIRVRTNDKEQEEVIVQYYAFSMAPRFLSRNRVFFRLNPEQLHPSEDVLLTGDKKADFSVLKTEIVVDNALMNDKSKQNPRAAKAAFSRLDPTAADLNVKVHPRDNNGTIKLTLTLKRALKTGEQLSGKLRVLTNDKKQKEVFIHYFATYRAPNVTFDKKGMPDFKKNLSKNKN